MNPIIEERVREIKEELRKALDEEFKKAIKEEINKAIEGDAEFEKKVRNLMLKHADEVIDQVLQGRMDLKGQVAVPKTRPWWWHTRGWMTLLNVVFKLSAIASALDYIITNR